MDHNSKFFHLGLFITILLLFLSGCSGGDVPVPTFVPTQEPTSIAATEVIPTSIPTPTPGSIRDYSTDREYAAVWVIKDEGLHVRNPAGISGSIVEDWPWNARQIYLTDNRSLLGSSLWVEILVNGDLTGWVNAWNITEYVSSEDFCQDQRVIDLLNSFHSFIQNPKDPTIQELVSPNHGLSFRHNWYNLDITFSRDEVFNAFSDVTEINWGVMADSGLEIIGSFEEILQPKIDDVFLQSPEFACNELQWGSTSGEVQWPDEFQNLNFYSFYRPADEEVNPLDWRTWAVGIEYVDGQPFLTVFIHYSSEL
jgi:hypothetical protein